MIPAFRSFSPRCLIDARVLSANFPDHGLGELVGAVTDCVYETLLSPRERFVREMRQAELWRMLDEE